MSERVAVIDYGMGNLGSIANMLRRIGCDFHLAASGEAIGDATRLILPGVGAFDAGMERLAARGLDVALDRKVRGEGLPILGICLGMQLFAGASEEGARPGFGWIDARVVRFPDAACGQPLRVPHMGWNTVAPARPGGLFAGLETGARFYFVHSYHVVLADPADALAATVHGRPFTSAIERGGVSGVQFHPEKSHRFGMRLLENFVTGAHAATAAAPAPAAARA